MSVALCLLIHVLTTEALASSLTLFIAGELPQSVEVKEELSFFEVESNGPISIKKDEGDQVVVREKTVLSADQSITIITE